MESSNMILELRNRTGLNRKEFANYMGIPLRTVEDWEAGRRKPPEYIPTLMAYKVNYDELVKSLMTSGGKISDPFGADAAHTKDETLISTPGSSVIKVARPEFTRFDAEAALPEDAAVEDTPTETVSENTPIEATSEETSSSEEARIEEARIEEATAEEEPAEPAPAPKPKPWYAANNRPLFG